MDGDREALRAALIRTDTNEGVAHASLVLSNGLFECELPRHRDPARAQQALNNLITAACREGARHLSVQLWRDEDAGWKGDYTGIGGGGPLDMSEENPKIADATWYEVDEAYLAYLDGARVSFPAEETLVLGAADGGIVRIDEADDERISGRVHMPEVGVTAEFEATVCDGEATQLRLIEASPKYICLTDAR